MDTKERYSRQSDIISMEKIELYPASVIGVGAIGRQVALELASIGVKHLRLVDFDKVEESNIASQGYYESDLGKLKVEATKEACLKINSKINISIESTRYRRSFNINGILFCCVDSIDTRKMIWESIQDKDISLFVDGRMAAEVLRVLSVPKLDNNAKEYYPTTLFSEGEAYTGSCTAKSTIYCASIAAAMMIASYTKWLRNIPVDKEVEMNILTAEISAA